MADREVVLTAQGLKKLEDELELLKTVRRKETLMLKCLFSLDIG